ncbi:MAG: hypothetical protein QNK84_08510 [Flavobacteriales bacterium]
MKKGTNILIISYLFDPDNSVGAKRATYWAKNISRLDNSISCDVISTIKNSNVSGVRDYWCIPNPNKPKGLIKDEGVTWKKEIRKWLEINKAEYDVVIFSGSPFMYFSLVKNFQKRGAKVILDYRDPFANNPRFGSSVLKIKIKAYYEKKFNTLADKVISVNTFCLSLLSKFNEDKFKVIKNGYDDVSVSKQSFLTKGKVNFVYAGTIYDHINPKILLSGIEKNNEIVFHHIGKESRVIKKCGIKAYGLKPYPEMLKGIDDADVGIIFSTGLSFESTTKIYDYIFMKKPIWVISNEEIKNGGIWDELKDYPAVVWSVNSEEAIQKDLPEVLNLINKNIDVDTSRYSREAGLKQLIQIIKDLC